MSPNYSLFDKYLSKVADKTISHFGSHEGVLQFLQAFKRYPGNVAFAAKAATRIEPIKLHRNYQRGG